MELMLDIDIKPLPEPIRYGDGILLVGSCFTEHIGSALESLKFKVLQNPHGILFDPHSTTRNLQSYIKPRSYIETDLFQLQEIWHSWEHHSRFSGTDRAKILESINRSQQQAHEFLKNAKWLVLTLGSSFSYRLTDQSNGKPGEGVANCHRAPAQWFTKHMQEISETITQLETCIIALREFNPGLNVIFTVSPVRHIRDGVVENNRSKARLLEAVHHVVRSAERCWYFPAYELVIDVLRDYRFYDIDLVHPNYAATEFVMQKFITGCIDPQSKAIMDEVRSMVTARKHRAFQPDTHAHREFLNNHLEKAKSMQAKYPFLDLEKEIRYFSASPATNTN